MARFIWVSANPSLKYFHRRLLKDLSKVVQLEFWEYYQTLDEGSSINNSIGLLHKYLANADQPVHLVGHGIGGTIALGYARKYPDQVVSLTLLSVGVQPAIDWHSYYYDRLRSLSSSRECILRSIAMNIFPNTCAGNIYDLVSRLRRDLVEAPSNHSLFKLDILAEGGVEMPLMICGSQDDPIINTSILNDWTTYFKPVDVVWQSATGGHFFHHFEARLVSDRIQKFWQQLEQQLVIQQLAHAKFN
jgi:pimeloyl-ACP methyl ester carboxylesterase